MEKVNAMYAKPWCSIGEVFHSYLLIWGLMFSVFMGALGFLIGLYLKTRREYIDKLNENYDKLKTLDETKDSLTHFIIHDLSTPLAVLISHLQLLGESLQNIVSEEQRGSLTSAFKASQEMKNMISNILDVSKIEEGKFKINFAGIDLNVLLMQVIDSMKILTHQQEKKISVNISSDIPKLLADGDILKRVISNLIWNSMKFTPQRSTIEIAAPYKKDTKMVEISVKDHGRGIPKEFCGSVFDKFTQIENNKMIDMTSKGLGLYFCKLAVEAHGGKIWVESKPGKGSIFYFTIPTQG